MISSRSLCVWVWQASRDISLNTVGNRHYRSSWCHQSSAYDLLQMWLKTMKGALESCRQGAYVTNSHIIYWNNPSTFSIHTGKSLAGAADKRMTSSSRAVTQTADALSQSKGPESCYKQEELDIVSIGSNGFLHVHRLHCLLCILVVLDMAEMPNRV